MPYEQSTSPSQSSQHQHQNQPSLSSDEIDPSSVILSFAITICILPLVASYVADPLLNQRSTLRDILTLYRGLILAGYFAFPIWIFLAETRSQGVFSLVVLLTVIGISWNTITSTLAGPPKYKLLRNPTSP